MTIEDCISRKDLLKKFEKECATDCSCCLYARDNDEIVGFGYREWCGLIEDAPSVTPKAEWIPVSERLPEDYIHVLCQFYLGGMGECYLAHGAFHVVGGLVMTCNEVIAWMPLPEPYNAESEG